VIRVRRSRFYAHLCAVEGLDDPGPVLAGHRDAYRKSAHHCGCGGVEVFKITVARSVDPDMCSSLSSESMVLRARRW
jgi:hypothetical protein